jgi:hypothetical protein
MTLTIQSATLLILMLLFAYLLIMQVITVVHTRGVSGGSITTTETVTVTGDGLAYANPTIPTAKAGTLSTRTSATAGVLTLATGHNLIVGQRIDISWTVGGVWNYCYGALVTVSASTTVTFSGASGTALPVVTSDITVCAAQEVEFGAVGNNLQSLCATIQTATGIITFASNSANLYSTYVYNGTPLIWKAGDASNPLSGLSATKVWMSSDKTTGQTTDFKAHAVTETTGTGSS